MKNFITKANLSGGDDSGTATKWGAKESNSVTDELKLAVTATGQSLAAGTGNDPSPDLLAKALTITAQTAHSYQDSGSVNAYTLTRTGSLEQPDSYIDGMRITFVTANENTGASTVSVSGLGVKSIVKAGDVALSAGDISENIYIELIYDPAADSASGGFVLTSAPTIKVTVLTISDPTWTPEDRTKSIEFIAIGAGGGGGGVDGQGAGTATCAGGGGGGGACVIATNTIDASYAIVIGASGSGGAAGANNGTAGGASTVTSTAVTLSAGGGSGGFGDTASGSVTTAPGGSRGTGTGGDYNQSGDSGFTGLSNNGVKSSYGHGGGSLLAGIIGAPGSDDAGAANTDPGGGGSGAVVQTLTTNYAGGDGADGIVIIKEYS